MKPKHIDLDEYEGQLKEAFAAQARLFAKQAVEAKDPNVIALVPVLERCSMATLPIYREMISSYNSMADPNIIASAVISICADMLANVIVNTPVEDDDRSQIFANVMEGLTHRMLDAIKTPPAFISKPVEGGNA